MKKREDQNPEENEQEQSSDSPKKERRLTPAEVDAITGSPTANVRARRHSDTFANTGTNTSYEGSTPPAGAGSTGSGSGQDATGARITTDATNDHIRTTRREDEEEENDSEKDAPQNFDEQEESRK